MVVPQADISGIAYFLPVLSFLLVFLIVYVFLWKTEIAGEHWFMQTLLSFIVATIFVSAVSARDFVLSIVPWFAILVVVMFLVLLFTGFIGDDMKGMRKGIGIGIMVIMLILFVIAAIFAFQPYYRGNPFFLGIKNWASQSRVFGAILLILVSIIVSWVLAKGGAKAAKSK